MRNALSSHTHIRLRISSREGNARVNYLLPLRYTKMPRENITCQKFHAFLCVQTGKLSCSPPLLFHCDSSACVPTRFTSVRCAQALGRASICTKFHDALTLDSCKTFQVGGRVSIPSFHTLRDFKDLCHPATCSQLFCEQPICLTCASHAMTYYAVAGSDML